MGQRSSRGSGDSDIERGYRFEDRSAAISVLTAKNFGTSLYALEQSVGQLSSAGVHIALGNDYAGGPGDFELGIPMIEIEEMAASGMTPMQVIEASTRNGAQELRLGSQVGTIETGKLADILVVAGDPLADLQALRSVRLVVHGGTIIRDELSAIP